MRPGFDAMHKDASWRKFDIVMAWSVDRLGRSLQDLIGFLAELHALGIDLAQGIDTTTPAGKAMFQMMGVFAEFERSMIVERVRAGVARGKASGTKSGKTFGRPRTSPEVEQRIREALANSWAARISQDRRSIRRRDWHGSTDRERIAPWVNGRIWFCVGDRPDLRIVKMSRLQDVASTRCWSASPSGRITPITIPPDS